MAKQPDDYKEKFRPDDAALDAEIEAALGGMSVEALYDATTPQARRQQRGEHPAAEGKGFRRGRVMRVTPDDVFIDFGGKSQGIVPHVQFEQEPKVGEEFDFHVERYDEREGLLILTRKGATATNVSWENMDVGQIVEGTVTGMNKGGLELDIKGMRAFMPAGQVDLYFQKDISTYIGQRLQVEVTRFERDARNLVVSRRNILEREK